MGRRRGRGQRTFNPHQKEKMRDVGQEVVDKFNSAWDADTLVEFREKLGMDRADLARFLGVDARTIWRWETGRSQPTGTARAIIDGVSAAFELHPKKRETMVKKIRLMNSVGGVAYMITRLIDELSEGLGR